MPRGGKGPRRGGRRGGLEDRGASAEQGGASPTAAPSEDCHIVIEAAVTRAPSEPTAACTTTTTTTTDAAIAARGAIRARGKWTRSQQGQSSAGADTPAVASPRAVPADDEAPPERDKRIHNGNHNNDDKLVAAPPPSRATSDDLSSSPWPSSTGNALLNRHRLCIAVDALEAQEAERREDIVDEELDDLERVVTNGLTGAVEDAGSQEKMNDEADAVVEGVSAESAAETYIGRSSETTENTATPAAAVEQPNDPVAAGGDDDAVAAFEEFTAAAPCEKQEAATPARGSSGAPQSAAKQYESICPCCVM